MDARNTIRLIKWLDGLEARCREAIQRCSSAIRQMERVQYYIDNLLETFTGWKDNPALLAVQPNSDVKDLVKMIRAGARREVEMLLRAEKGIKEFSVKWRPDGLAEVEIDGKRFRLSKRLGALLEVLADRSGTSRDQFVPWKDRATVKQMLKTRLGQEVSDHTLDHWVYRLRSELYRKAGLPPAIVHVNRALGLRLALHQRPARPVSSCDLVRVE